MFLGSAYTKRWNQTQLCLKNKKFMLLWEQEKYDRKSIESRNSMRKIILDVAVSLDNYIEGPHGEIDWCMIDDDMQFDTFLASVDSILWISRHMLIW